MLKIAVDANFVPLFKLLSSYLTKCLNWDREFNPKKCQFFDIEVLVLFELIIHCSHFQFPQKLSRL